MDDAMKRHRLPVEMTALPRDTWTDERIASIRAAHARQPFDTTSMALVAALDEMVLLRRDLSRERLGEPSDAPAKAPLEPVQAAVMEMAKAWRAVLDSHLEENQVPPTAPHCAALPGMWWRAVGHALMECAAQEQDAALLFLVTIGMFDAGIPPSDVSAMLRANPPR